MRVPLTVVCALYLAWLGIRSLIDAWKLPESDAAPASTRQNALAVGAAISLANPKNIVYWGALGSALSGIVGTTPSHGQTLMFFAGFMLAFVISLDDVVITNFVKSGGQDTLPTYLLGELRRNLTSEIYAISSLLLLISVLVVVLDRTGYLTAGQTTLSAQMQLVSDWARWSKGRPEQYRSDCHKYTSQPARWHQADHYHHCHHCHHCHRARLRLLRSCRRYDRL